MPESEVNFSFRSAFLPRGGFGVRLKDMQIVPLARRGGRFG
jgi:hypothetical protein